MKKIILLLSVAFVFALSAEASAKVVTVQKGDSMWLIAKRYNVPFSEVIRLNKAHHIDVNLIHPNDKIYLPDGTTGASTTHESRSDTIKEGNNNAPDHAVKTQAEAVLLLVNQERKKQGLKELTLSQKLTDVAFEKAKDMNDKNYFSHTSPTYGSPFAMMQTFGITYHAAGENIAKGQRTAQEVMNSWMHSSGHRENILNPNYTQLGVGYYSDKSTFWVQMFIKP